MVKGLRKGGKPMRYKGQVENISVVEKCKHF